MPEDVKRNKLDFEKFEAKIEARAEYERKKQRIKDIVSGGRLIVILSQRHTKIFPIRIFHLILEKFKI